MAFVLSVIWEISALVLIFKKQKTTKKWVPCSPALWVTCANVILRHFHVLTFFSPNLLLVFFLPDIPWSAEASTFESLLVCVYVEPRGRHCVPVSYAPPCLSQLLWSVLSRFHEPDLQWVPVSLRITGLRSSCFMASTVQCEPSPESFHETLCCVCFPILWFGDPNDLYPPVLYKSMFKLSFYRRSSIWIYFCV